MLVLYHHLNQLPLALGPHRNEPNLLDAPRGKKLTTTDEPTTDQLMQHPNPPSNLPLQSRASLAPVSVAAALLVNVCAWAFKASTTLRPLLLKSRLLYLLRDTSKYVTVADEIFCDFPHFVEEETDSSIIPRRSNSYTSTSRRPYTCRVFKTK